MKPKRVVELLRALAAHPHPQVCPHLIATMVLDIMGEEGYHVPDELMKAVCRAQDEKTLRLLCDFEFIILN